MPNHTLLRELLHDEEMTRQLEAVFGPATEDWLTPETQLFRENSLLTARVICVTDDGVRVDVGYKSDAFIPLHEWRDEATNTTTPPCAGDEVSVFVVSIENNEGTIVLSHRRARRLAAWQKFTSTHDEGDQVTGTVLRTVPGGLLVDVGVAAFLPTSQVDIRRPTNLRDYVGKKIDATVLRLDPDRQSVVISRRRQLIDEHPMVRHDLLANLVAGQVRKGIVKNIAEFGAFVDLGGIDGLLHITNLSWQRVTDVHAFVRLDQELDVYILDVDRSKEKIALSLKHLTPSPWVNIAQKYPVGSRQKVKVMNVMPYGVFAELEPGVEGLIHITEMSWTRRIANPSEMVQVGDEIDVQVLLVNEEKSEISLGMRQLTMNPWDTVPQRYPLGMVVTGTVRNLTTYGAFVTLEEGIDALLHVTDMSHVRKPAHPNELLSMGDKITCVVLRVDAERQRMMLGLKQLHNDPWDSDIPSRYAVGDTREGKVTRVTNFGAFVQLEPGLEGLLHVSEMGDKVAVGELVTVRVLRVDPRERRIGLSSRA